MMTLDDGFYLGNFDLMNTGNFFQICTKPVEAGFIAKSNSIHIFCQVIFTWLQNQLLCIKVMSHDHAEKESISIFG